MYTGTIIERILMGNYASREKKLYLNVIIGFNMFIHAKTRGAKDFVKSIASRLVSGEYL